MRTLAILPVKSFERGKQRLQPGLDPKLRQALAEAMLLDVLDALGSSAIDEVVVVSSGARVRRIAHDYGATAVEDRDEGHNAAAGLGIRAARALGAQRALLVPGDCPALDPGDVDALLARAARAPAVVIVPDRHGTGTNALLLTPPGALAPSFGPGSCQRHQEHARAAGIAAEVVELPSLALDIDTPDDLAALAAAPGRAPRTRQLLS
jgi:2-phospho-L-lactate/phosphoenolpyruvate guanylyltransferase